MASSTSSSSIQKGFKYDVFLSFRGEDTRKTFVDHLYLALVNKGIITYKDDEKIEKGERISEQLIRSIEDSRFYIIVFSKTYASSSWCLDELVKIMECQKTIEKTAYPVFYDVEPTEVRNQSGSVGEAFERFTRKRKRSLEDLDLLDKGDKENDVGRWRYALKEAAGLAGWELKNTVDGYEAKLIQKIVMQISLKLSFINWSVDMNLVGMEARVKNVVSSLKIGFDDVRMIGIKGMGGGGKTTLATAVFDHISNWFEGVSFAENVREVSKSSLSGLKVLQKQLLSDVLNDKESIVVKSLSDGKNKIKRIMGSRKVLVVLDDVDDIGQLEALAGDPTWFKAGSRIIITTRDEQVLVAHGVHSDNIHDVSFLSCEEAICLFSRNAFKREIPDQGYQELSTKVVHYAAGLPLTIKVLGSHLCGRTKREWVDAIERLKTIPLKQTLEKLELSYDGLENDQKEVFLDVACILKGELKEDAIRILESCGFHAEIGLRVLEQKSLLTISNASPMRLHPHFSYYKYGRRLYLHDHIEEMGRNIVRRLHPEEPRRHSRLWIKKEIEEILVNGLGTKATRSIKLQNTNLDATLIMKGLRKMKELRFLFVKPRREDMIVDEVNQYLPDTLRSIHWRRYPFWCLPKTFQANNLVNLEMRSSNISELWEGGERKVLKNLIFLDLSDSNVRTFDLELTPHLETLYLSRCFDFVELHVAFKCPKLKFLNLTCSKVSNFNLGMTPHLETLDLRECNQFVELHMPVECPKLEYLNLSGSKVSNLNLGQTPNIKRLDLGGCHCLQEIHVPVGCPKLEYLDLRGSKVSNLNLGQIPNIKWLDLDGCHCLQEIHAPVGCPKLEYLDLRGSKVSNLNLGQTPNIQRLDLGGCHCLQEIHAPVGCLNKLVYLNISGCWRFEYFLVEKRYVLPGLDSLAKLELTAESLNKCPLHPSNNFPKFRFKCKYDDPLPLSSGNLEKLISFVLCACTNLESFSATICGFQCLGKLKLEGGISEVAKDLYRLQSLKELTLSMKEIKQLPDSICMLKHLKSLDLKSCWLLEQLPMDLGRLECLKRLILTECTHLQDIPNSICEIKCLEYLILPYCILLEKLPEELGRLKHLVELDIEGAGISHLPQSISQLKDLRIVGSRWQLESYGSTPLRSAIFKSRYAAMCYVKDVTFRTSC